MADTDKYFRVFFREYEGGGPELRIYNAKDSFHALCKLLTYVAEESAENDCCVYLGDWGFEMKASNCLTAEEKVIHCENDVIRIE